MTEPLVIRHDTNACAHLVLNRPEKLNALTPSMFIELRQHLVALADDDTIRCVVLAGRGRSFCAGHDLAAIADHQRAPSAHFEAETIDLLEQLPQPTIGQIHGHCFTGGLELALGCDILIAAETATFADSHGHWGLVPVWGMSVRLPERVGTSKAKELMLTSRRISAHEAVTIGLVDRCVATDELADSVEILAQEITTNSAGTNSIVKRLLRDRTSENRETLLRSERTLPYGLPTDMAERMSQRPPTKS